MANIKSQKKRILVTAKENASNNAKRSTVKTAIKKLNAAIQAKDLTLAEQLFPATVSTIKKAESDGVLHKNAASRRVATISRSMDALRTEKNA